MAGWILVWMGLAWGQVAVEDQQPAEAVEQLTEDPDDAPANPRSRVVYDSFTAARVNPLGLASRLRLGYRLRLYDSDHFLFEDSYVQFSGVANLTPSYGQLGGRVEISPLAVLVLWAEYTMLGFFGTFDAVMPFERTQADYWETTIAARGEAGDNYATTATRLTLGGTLQAKVGPIAVRSTLNMTRANVDMKDGAPYFYDALEDLLLEDGGWQVTNDLDVVGFVGDHIVTGARYTYADALHGGDGGVGDMPIHRVGPLFAYTFFDKPTGTGFDTPTILVLLQWYGQHPWRAGREFPQGVPLGALAFTFTGDLWVSRK